MATTTRMFLLNNLRQRYHQANKANKIKLLDEFCQNFGYNRKYAISLLRPRGTNSIRGQDKRGPKPIYCPEQIVPILKTIWLACDQLCSKKLVALLPAWLPFYESRYGLLDEQLRIKVLSISPATIDRLLTKVKIKYKAKGLSGTKPGSLLKHQIPIHNNYWNELEPGFLEADTVAHCGDSMAGNFAWTLTMTDIFSCWTELRAVWNKGSDGVVEQVTHVEQHLPFQIKGFDCDNGSEFLNYHLLRYFTERQNRVIFTRSRPYRKNDNAHVEQKNWSCVRQLIGYDRIIHEKAIQIMNDLYMNEWSLLNNFFIPTMKLENKIRDGAKIKKKHSKPMTPYERLMKCKKISESTKNELYNKYTKLDPFELKLNLETKLKRLTAYMQIKPSKKQRI